MWKKCKEWFRRYFPAEIVGTFTAITAAWMAHSCTRNSIVVAYSASVGEAIGFYATFLSQRIVFVRRENKLQGVSFGKQHAYKLGFTLLFEFGPAGVIDGLVLRPFFMLIFLAHIKSFTLGVFLAKITGDISFYVLVILAYEWRLSLRKK